MCLVNRRRGECVQLGGRRWGREGNLVEHRALIHLANKGVLSNLEECGENSQIVFQKHRVAFPEHPASEKFSEVTKNKF